LICAIELHRAGHPVVLLEADDDVGGRVRSSVTQGVTLDHAFQVLFTAYPTLNRYLDHAALALRPFVAGARIVRSGRAPLVADAMVHPRLLAATLSGGALPLGDLRRLWALKRFVTSLSVDDCFAPEWDALSTRDLLGQRGFSASAIDGFFAPFYGGILLDRSLSTSAAILLFTFKMLAQGSTAVPARGMGAITAQLAAQLPRSAVRVGARVRAVERDSRSLDSRSHEPRVRGVVLEDGSRFEAPHVVLATDAPATARLLRTVGIEQEAPTDGLGCSTLYFTSERPLLSGAALWLNADASATISHAVTLTDVAPEYAPAGTALLAATAVGRVAGVADEELERSARADLTRMAAAAGVRESVALNHVATWRVPYAQYRQPPGATLRRASVALGMHGLWRASETLHTSSLEGAARGGVAAAQAIRARGR
jgi:phytoene dehydrogenase-like protein